jgi:hypothetical protein
MRLSSSISSDIRTIGKALVSIASALDRSPLWATPAAAPIDQRRPRAKTLKLSARRRAALKLQGQYMGHIRMLKPRQKVRVKALRQKKGMRAAIALAQQLSTK